MQTKAKARLLRSGEFLLRAAQSSTVFTPEDMSDEQRMLRQSVKDFIQQHIDARWKDFDGPKGYELAPKLLEEAGKMGFLGVGVPEEYGGYEADFRTQLLFTEYACDAWSFGLAMGIQTSLGVAPVLLYGSDEQKRRYLPGIVSGEIKTCYCLTEPGAGSDANAAKTTATLSEDGKHYRLNGQKMWITSSGYADVFFVFARIEDDPSLSCLIVEKGSNGIRLGEEEEKMGIKGSSTRQVFFEDVEVPVEQLLGARNKGFKIALNVLNTGRIKMATTACGTSKRALGYAATYASERQQFGQPIASFGAIQNKLGNMAARLYAMESMAYRIGGQIDSLHERLLQEDSSDPNLSKQEAIRAFAMECAIAKVHNTDSDGFIIDEALQIHGGMGYSGETPIETMYRNHRITRIYEGTNEINRMLSVEMLLRQIRKQENAFMQSSAVARHELEQDALHPFAADDIELGPEKAVLRNLKKIGTLIGGYAFQTLTTELPKHQEVLMHLADVFIQIYAYESTLLRTEKWLQRPDAELRKHLLDVHMHHAVKMVSEAATEALMAFADPGEGARYREAIRTLRPRPWQALAHKRRVIAEAVIEAQGYPIKN